MSMGSRLRTRRKQIITHTLIVGGFLFFLLFLAEPLFVRFEPGEVGMAKLHKITLLSETNDIHYEIDRITLGNKVGIYGWAFIGGQSMEHSQTYVVLRSTNNTYVFDTFIWPRPDVTEAFGYLHLHLDLDHSGFVARISMHEIEDGTYRVGLYIKKGRLFWIEAEALRYTRQLLIVKSGEAVEQVYLASTLQLVALPEPSANLLSYIDYLGKVDSEGEEFIEIRGWAFIEGQSPAQSQTYVVLKSNGTAYVFDTWPKYTPWVPLHFDITDLGLEWAGFIARIPKEVTFEDGAYKVGIYVKKGDMEALQYTDKVLTKTKEIVEFE